METVFKKFTKMVELYN